MMRYTRTVGLGLLVAAVSGAPAIAVGNPLKGRSPVMVAEQRLAEARRALGRGDAAAAADAINDAIEMAQRFEQRRPSARMIDLLDACLAEVDRANLPAVVQRAEGLREALVTHELYVDTTEALAAVNAAADAAGRGESAATAAALVRAKRAVRVVPIADAQRAARIALGAAYRSTALGDYSVASEELDRAEAALRRAEHKVVLAQALAQAYLAQDAEADNVNYRAAAGHAAKAAAILTDARTHLTRETERAVHEVVTTLTELVERAKQKNPTVWEELRPAIAQLEDMLAA